MTPIETARSLNLPNLNAERAVTMFLLWLSWYQDDIAGAVAFAGDQIETEEEVGQFKEALERLDNRGR